MTKKSPKPKAAKNPKPTKAKQPAGKHPLADVVELKISQIDRGPAESVRDGLHEETVQTYCEAYKNGEKLPPLEVFTDGKIYKLGDGGHRIESADRAEHKTILCNLHRCDSVKEAEEYATAFAAGANEIHGLRRRNEDRRASVTMILLRPEYGESSDREVARVCRVNHPLVRLVREKLTADGKLNGSAASTSRDYKADAHLVGNRISDGKGKMIARPPKPPEATKPQEEPATETIEESTGRTTTEELATPVLAGQKPPVIKDSKGRDVPEKVYDIFAARSIFPQAAASVNEALKPLIDNRDKPICASISQNALDIDRDNLLTGIKDAKPYCVCPACDGLGEKLPAGPKRPKCGVCSGKGWISVSGWKRLTKEQKEVAGGYGETLEEAA